MIPILIVLALLGGGTQFSFAQNRILHPEEGVAPSIKLLHFLRVEGARSTATKDHRLVPGLIHDSVSIQPA